MRKNEDTIAAITAEWPDLLHGKDFWVGQPMDGAEQTGPAFIAAWNANSVDEPDDDAINALIEKHRSVVDELVNRVPVPETVTMAQARIALSQAGLIDQVSQGLQGLPDGPEKDAALTAWEYAPNVSRNGALINTLGAALGFSDEQLDKLFIAASKIDL